MTKIMTIKTMPFILISIIVLLLLLTSLQAGSDEAADA